MVTNAAAVSMFACYALAAIAMFIPVVIVIVIVM